MSSLKQGTQQKVVHTFASIVARTHSAPGKNRLEITIRYNGRHRTRLYEYSAAAPATLGTPRVNCTQLSEPNKPTTAEVITDLCDLIITQPLMNGRGPVVAESERE
ncbi:hypothetical protein Q8A73_012850 [Channa argus]|nr:hypothetical protein Q8A73_012850 [Channa argus]